MLIQKGRSAGRFRLALGFSVIKRQQVRLKNYLYDWILSLGIKAVELVHVTFPSQLFGRKWQVLTELTFHCLIFFFFFFNSELWIQSSSTYQCLSEIGLSKCILSELHGICCPRQWAGSLSDRSCGRTLEVTEAVLALSWGSAHWVLPRSPFRVLSALAWAWMQGLPSSVEKNSSSRRACLCISLHYPWNYKVNESL